MCNALLQSNNANSNNGSSINIMTKLFDLKQIFELEAKRASRKFE